MNGKKNNKYNLYIIIYLFMFIYSPWLLSINVVHLITLLSLVLYIFYLPDLLNVLLKSKLLNLIIPLVICIAYLTIVIMINGTSYMGIYNYFQLCIEIAICILYLCLYFKKKKYTYEEIINLILIVAFIQCIISICMFLNPEFKKFILDLTIPNIDNPYMRRKIASLSSLRMNGLSGYLLYTTPIIHSYLAGICLYLGLTKEKKYFIYLPFLIFAAIINTRSSIVICILMFILVILFFKKNIRNLLKIFASIILMILLIPLLLGIIKKNANYVYNWIVSGFEEIISLMLGNSTGYFQIVSEGHINLPDIKGFLFGTGSNIFYRNNMGVQSDIGYINDIWMGGILFCITLIVMFIMYYIKICNEYKFNKFIVTANISIFLIANIKGSVIGINDFIILSMLLTSTYLVINEKGKKSA